MSNKLFIQDCQTLLNGLPLVTGDAARLAYRLSEAIDLLGKYEKPEDKAVANWGKPTKRVFTNLAGKYKSGADLELALCGAVGFSIDPHKKIIAVKRLMDFCGCRLIYAHRAITEWPKFRALAFQAKQLPDNFDGYNAQ